MPKGVMAEMQEFALLGTVMEIIQVQPMMRHSFDPNC